jgi:small nuclear ribonucleoprotein (snRNP)-like protein
MLDKGTFIKECPRHTVKARTSSLSIINRDTRTIKSILNGKNDKVNLVLRDVTVIKGFHVNIVFKALLYKKRTWYYKYDSTLRIKDKYKSNVLLIITRIYNIVFIKYKPLLTYLNALFTILINARNMLIYLTLERKIKESFKRNKKYFQSRSDIKERWYARARHLKSQVL